jgi:hypothetical protein
MIYSPPWTTMKTSIGKATRQAVAMTQVGKRSAHAFKNLFIMRSSPSILPLRLDQRRSTYYQRTTLSPNPVSFVFVGGGPRGALCLNAFIATLLSHRSDVEALTKMGAKYDVTLTVVDSQEEEQLARGNSFGREHTGISNAGTKWKLTPRLASTADKTLSTVLEMGDIARRIEHSTTNYAETEARMKKTNPVAAIMFQTAARTPTLAMDRELGQELSCLTRSDVGESLLATFREFCSAAKQKLPFLSLDIQTNTQVRKVSLGKDNGLAVTTQDARTGGSKLVKADAIKLFTGTTLKPPQVHPTVATMMYCDIMTPQKIREFLSARGLLSHNRLKVGSRVLIGGSNLSAIDTMVALEPFMGLVEENSASPGGYCINENAAREYAGAITFVSRTDCSFAIPRVSFGEGWRQEHDAFGTSKHQHALFLHEHGQDLFSAWTAIQKAGIARTNGILPSQVYPKYGDTKAQLAGMYEASKIYFENMERAGQAEQSNGADSKEAIHYLDKATHSLYGARMQAALNRIDGYGMERDLNNVRESMSEFAPLTWGGRNGLAIVKAQLAVVTNPAFAGEKSNDAIYKDWMRHEMDVSGSPPAMHSLVAKLSEAGVVNFVTADYADIEPAPSNDALRLNSDRFDAFLVSPVFNRDAEDTAQAFAGQVLPAHPDLGMHAIVGKNRAVVSKGGELSNVEDYGLSGCGTKIQHKDGSRSHLNAYAVDINAISSALATMPSVAMRMAAAAHLTAAGVENPWGKLHQFVDECKPSIEDYDAEVAKFAPIFKEAHELALFYGLIEQSSNGNPAVFAKGYDASGTKESRDELIHELGRSKCTRTLEAKRQYDNAILSIPTFIPPSRDDYFARFVDTTEKEDIAIYERALELARDKLKHLSV